MKAWQVRAWGEPETMTLAEVPVPEPGAGQVRIRNRGAGLNFFDILQVQGKYQVKPPFPFTPGAEVAGVVDAVGSGVTQFAIGDAVLSLCNQGGFAEYTVVDAARTFHVPVGMPLELAAAVPVVYLNNLTGTATLVDSTGTPVAGLNAVAFAYVAASNGIYRALVEQTFSPTPGLYTIQVRFTAPGGEPRGDYYRELPMRVVVR